MKKTAFLFPGQGSQSVGMGQEFYQEYDVAREIFDMTAETVRMNMSQLIFKGPMEDLTMTVNLQPAVTAVDLACLAVIEKEGGSCQYTAGHSLGEYGALCAAGVISGEDTIKLVHRRGELMHRESIKHKGAMSAIVGLTIEAVSELVEQVQPEGIVSVANHNTEHQIVITGSPQPVEKVSALAAQKGAKSIPLKVSGAWHSELIKGAESEFGEHLGTFSFVPPQKPVVFNVTADFCEDPEEIKGIMKKQFCSPVRWYDSMCKLIDEKVEIFVEVGPGRVLAGLLKKILPKENDCQVFNVSNMKQLENYLTKTS